MLDLMSDSATWADPYRAPLEVLESPAASPSIDARFDVLVVEDHGPSRRALELSLGHLGHLVFSAASLRDARVLLGAFAIDVIVCDVHLSDGSGFELLSLRPPGLRRISTIAISGLGEPTLPDRCRRAGFDAFVAKPLQVEELAGVIRRVTRRD